MKKKLLAVSLLSLSLLLASCGGGNTSASDGSNSGASDQTSTSAGAGSSTSAQQEKYVVSLPKVTGVTVTSDKEKAVKGETVTLTIALEDGFLLKSIALNGSENSISKVNETTYTFVMPNQSAVITVSLGINAAVSLQGEIATALTKGSDGIYSAKNISVAKLSKFSFFVGSTKLTLKDIDSTKCFCDVSDYYSSTDTSSDQPELLLAGGAVYDFFYDENADPEAGTCYIRRTKLLSFPSDVSTLHSLFDGRAKSEPTMWPSNVKKVSYKNNVLDEDYSWENGTNGSLAKVKTIKGADKAVTYRAIDDKTYTVVDNYTDSEAHAWTGDDYDIYAGKYNIVNLESDIGTGRGHYDVSKFASDYEAHIYSHNMDALYFDFMDGYYVGFNPDTSIGTDGLKKYNISITSTETADGFKTVLSSWRDIDTTQVTSISEADKEVNHYVYNGTFVFDKAGAPISGVYSGIKYGTDAYDMASGTFLDGGESKGVTVDDLSWNYEYGEVTSEVSFDTTPYFISSLENVVINDGKTDKVAPANAVQRSSNNVFVNDSLTFDYLPTTALDKWQYSITKSSDTSVIRPRSSSEPYRFVAAAKGTSTLTIGNNTTNSPSKDVAVEVVDNVTVHSFYLIGKDGPYSASNELLTTATSFSVEAGKKMTFQIWGSPSSIALPVTLVSGNGSLVSVNAYSDSSSGQEIWYAEFDASKASVTSNTVVDVTVNSNYYESGFGPSVINVTVTPATEHVSLLGGWTLSGAEKTATMNVQQYVTGDKSTYSTITIGDTSYSFTYSYDDTTGKTSLNPASGLAYVAMSYDSETDELGIFACVQDWGGQDEITTTAILGSGTYDEENGFEPTGFDYFARNKA